MTDKLKMFTALSVFAIIASLYQIATKTYSYDRTFLVIYCVIILLFNRDKAFSKNRLASIIGILTILLLVVKSVLARLA
ncbi:hypothetical protein [Pseudolactococcus insecticola]|uniref:Uncharacterized protein n=1 Tax=Pseudolactococcus insecticola TaxID=2709158 RepID=A0A6A0B9L2_9LACT|nr:hypothetical protein [Lactococcus insecticola]GFH41034.1 hypothetical protein Hs20B_14320 [Lactococcus insecticola]